MCWISRSPFIRWRQPAFLDANASHADSGATTGLTRINVSIGDAVFLSPSADLCHLLRMSARLRWAPRRAPLSHKPERHGSEGEHLKVLVLSISNCSRSKRQELP